MFCAFNSFNNVNIITTLFSTVDFEVALVETLELRSAWLILEDLCVCMVRYFASDNLRGLEDVWLV